MIWRQLADWARYFLKHKEQTDKNTDELHDQRMSIHTLTTELAEFKQEFARYKEIAVAEREIQALRLENILLRSDRQLPSPPHDEDEHAELLQVIETLKREIAELKLRLGDSPSDFNAD